MKVATFEAAAGIGHYREGRRLVTVRVDDVISVEDSESVGAILSMSNGHTHTVTDTRERVLRELGWKEPTR